ncbi:restriction endonuclease subunit S [Leuconostoc mesenteroides]|uniref:restriction endonuclease subunit S n=1 Tax=Leuconostoc mesenteroides TaxID=1245 RepID=UPI00236112D6|nr:restriction endonuclease subunit S [Leuconostoc mesenteroides]
MSKMAPQIRFQDFTDDWEERKLEELTLVLTGFPFKNEDFVDNGKYLVITNGNIQNESSAVDVSLGNRVDDLSDEIKERYYLNKNDILVTMDGTVGRTAKVVDDNMILAQRVARLVANKNTEFVYQWLNQGSFFNEMTKVSHGGTIKHISLNEISNYSATVPSNNIEQQKIGSFFKQLDDTIALHQRKLDLLKEQKKGFLQKMFPKNGSKFPELRFSGFADDWEERKLGELGSVAMNRRIFKDQTSENEEVPFFKIGTFGSKPDAFISRELFEEYKLKYPYPEIGDILISASGSIGRTVVYQGEDEYFQDSNIVWLKHDNRLDNKFLKQFYSIVKWQGLEGSTIKRLYNKNILDTDISIPSTIEQNKIGMFFEQLDDTIALHQRKLDLLKEQKKGFLQKMFVS